MVGSSATTTKLPGRVYLIPGFFSPRWMMLLLQRHLRSAGMAITTWDYPRVFSNVEENVDRLATLLANERDDVAIVAHSFGDWVARQSIQKAGDPAVQAFVSICPVRTAVPLAQWVHKLSGDRIPEIAIMADKALLELNPMPKTITRHTTIWARWEWLVKTTGSNRKTRFILGTHNSILFQPNLWRLVESELTGEEESQHPANLETLLKPS